MLLLYTLAHPILSQSAVQFDASLSILDAPDIDTQTCDILLKCRSLKEILWTCGSVLFVCIWAAVHPNAAHPKDHVAVIRFKHTAVSLFALLGPELIVMWALRQWCSSLIVWNKYKRYGWTKSHAFLAIMGGFALYDENGFVGILWDREDPSYDLEVFRGTLDRMQAEGIDTSLEACAYDPENKPSEAVEKASLEDIGKDIPSENVGDRPRCNHDPASRSMNDRTIESKTVNVDEPAPPISQTVPATELTTATRKPSCLLEFLVAKGFIDITEDEVMAKGEGDVLSKIVVFVQVGCPALTRMFSLS
ncbi:hypothetical protein Moror_3684 [Moniliophthora roreri MCA 2997]|uniref:Uncharacterized protein n=1 Tax=Moniliophthora roreri (strain MCA 2997) TaxID=1381753 RepID=V2W6X8_MONRO|nr:hypothetical protein Moror_3684 [Moniliophthora roreri MCA 2997]